MSDVFPKKKKIMEKEDQKSNVTVEKPEKIESD